MRQQDPRDPRQRRTPAPRPDLARAHHARPLDRAARQRLGRPRPTALASLATLGLAASLLLSACPAAHGPDRKLRYPIELPPDERGPRVIVFDVGQGDAQLIEHRGRTLLVDCGVSRFGPRTREADIAATLERLTGRRHLDYLFVTHLHADHIGGEGKGVWALLDREGVTVGALLDPGLEGVEGPKGLAGRYRPAVQRWLAAGQVKERRELTAGDRIDLGPGALVEVISSGADGRLQRLRERHPTFTAAFTDNDVSVCLKLRVGDFEYFSCGDLSGKSVLRDFGQGASAYSDIESRIAGRVGAVEVYRVNHHGSAHSTNECFVEVLRPQVSIFSTGRNSYGHPDPEVYRRLAAVGETWITGGAAKKSHGLVADAIVGGDIELLVRADGQRFWVNGHPYASQSDEEELARPGARERCEVPDELSPEEYRGKH